MAFARSKDSAAARGYGKEHQALRRKLIAELDRAGVGVCCIGGEPIYPGQRVHLDHSEDRRSYRGLACEKHNRQDGARRGRARQSSSRLIW